MDSTCTCIRLYTIYEGCHCHGLRQTYTVRLWKARQTDGSIKMGQLRPTGPISCCVDCEAEIVKLTLKGLDDFHAWTARWLHNGTLEGVRACRMRACWIDVRRVPWCIARRWYWFSAAAALGIHRRIRRRCVMGCGWVSPITRRMLVCMVQGRLNGQHRNRTLDIAFAVSFEWSGCVGFKIYRYI